MFFFCNFLSFCEKRPHENRKLCCVWLLITFAFACVLIHGLHLKWSLRSSCLLLGLFTSFVGRREFALSVVEATCLEETLFKVVRACMRKTVLRMIL